MGFLRMSGMDIPKEAAENILIPVVLKHEFEVEGSDATKVAAKKINQGEIMLARQIRPYIHIEHTRTEKVYKVRMYLIIQRFKR